MFSVSIINYYSKDPLVRLVYRCFGIPGANSGHYLLAKGLSQSSYGSGEFSE